MVQHHFWNPITEGKGHNKSSKRTPKNYSNTQQTHKLPRMLLWTGPVSYHDFFVSIPTVMNHHYSMQLSLIVGRKWL